MMIRATFYAVDHCSPIENVDIKAPTVLLGTGLNAVLILLRFAPFFPPAPWLCESPAHPTPCSVSCSREKPLVQTLRPGSLTIAPHHAVLRDHEADRRKGNGTRVAEEQILEKKLAGHFETVTSASYEPSIKQGFVGCLQAAILNSRIPVPRDMTHRIATPNIPPRYPADIPCRFEIHKSHLSWHTPTLPL